MASASCLPPPSPSPPPSPLQISPSPTPDNETTNKETLNSPKSKSPTPKKSQPVPWTHQETINLIQAYQQKWYSLRKGQLKASQWQQVADAVTKRCHYSSKSVTQCRHKIEKLRKRFRAEKIKSFPNSWPYFDLMDRMERGPLPVLAPLPVDHYNPNSCSSDSDFLDHHKAKSLNHIVRGGVSKARLHNEYYNNNVEKSDRVFRVSRSPIVRKRKEISESDIEKDEDGYKEVEEKKGESSSSDVVVAQLAVEIRGFADKFVNMEHIKMEMMRDMERYRMEMENKRMEMILESQRKLVHTIRKAFSSSSS